MSKSLTDYEILCLSHLRWETTLFQRPQQLMSQFDAMGVGVFYLSQWSTRRWVAALLRGHRDELTGRAGSRLLWRNWPYTPAMRFSPLAASLNLRLFGMAARRFLAVHQTRPLLVWLYHPWAYPLLERIPFELLVYDCMDPFVAFRLQRRKQQIDEQEHALIRRASLVFTGGPSLQAAKEGINPHTYCFPSGLDFEHFAKALDEQTAQPADAARLPHPVFGYWGAVDERIDFALLERLCDRWPEGSVVLLGPLIAMEKPPLEKPNFHYLGAKEYAQLPGYLAAFDVCLLPFVTSALTASISPTKTPEYLAGGRPVVSTAIPDVADVWGDVVGIGEDGGAFIAAVESALQRPRPDPRLAEAARQRAATWDDTATAMRERIEAVIAERCARSER